MQRRAVVALGKALAVHDALPDQLGVGVQEAVGGDELHLGRVRPARQQRLQHARRRRLADRDRAGDADDVGHLAVGRAEEALRRLEQPLRRRDVEREQARQRQIDGDDLVERDRIVGRLQLAQIVDRQRELGVGAQLRPFVAGEAAERGLRAIEPRPDSSELSHWRNLGAGGLVRRVFTCARRLFLVAALPDRFSSSFMTDDSATPRARSTTSRW